MNDILKHKELLGKNYYDPESQFRIGDKVIINYNGPVDYNNNYKRVGVITGLHGITYGIYSDSNKPSRHIWMVKIDYRISSYNEDWLEMAEKQ